MMWSVTETTTNKKKLSIVERLLWNMKRLKQTDPKFLHVKLKNIIPCIYFIVFYIVYVCHKHFLKDTENKWNVVKKKRLRTDLQKKS